MEQYLRYSVHFHIVVLNLSQNIFFRNLVFFLTRLWDGRFGDRIPVVEERLFSYSKHPDTLGPTKPPIQLVTGLFLGARRPGLEVGPSPPSSAEIKNEWSCTSAPAICLRVMARDSKCYFCRIDHSLSKFWGYLWTKSLGGYTFLCTYAGCS
jgi:hypothetical protein